MMHAACLLALLLCGCAELTICQCTLIDHGQRDQPVAEAASCTCSGRSAEPTLQCYAPPGRAR